MCALVVNNLFLLEEHDRTLFENQCAAQGNKIITYIPVLDDGVNYLGISGTEQTPVAIAAFISKEPTVVRSFDGTLTPYLDVQAEFFDDTYLKIGKTFTYNDYSFYIYSYNKSNTTGRITVRGRAATK